MFRMVTVVSSVTGFVLGVIVLLALTGWWMDANDIEHIKILID